MTTLLDTLAAELERPRELSDRVIRYITGTYELERDSVGAFLTGELPKLEDYEIDLTLSPVFTPKLRDQVIFAALLRGSSVPRSQWPELVTALVERPTHAHLTTADGQSAEVPLRAVSIERFVHRLRLEGSVPAEILALIDKLAEADRPLVTAVARQAIWEAPDRGRVLKEYLEKSAATGSTDARDVVRLLHVMEDRNPSGLTDLIDQIPKWRESLRQQIEAAGGPKPFFSGDIQVMHGLNDQRGQDVSRIELKQQERDFLERLFTLLTP